MRIEFELLEDKATKNPFWSAKVKQGDNVVMQVVSQTFNPDSNFMFRKNYESCAIRLITELMKEKDIKMVKHLLINNQH